MISDLSPTLEQFRKLAVERRVIPVFRRFLADGESAIGLYTKLAANLPGTYLLESAEQGVWSRYSFIGVRAADWWRPAFCPGRDAKAVAHVIHRRHASVHVGHGRLPQLRRGPPGRTSARHESPRSRHS